LVGPFTVVRDGRPVPITDVGSRKARTLLALLALAGGRIVPTDRIVEVLWPGVPPRKPAENVATLVSRVRAALGVGVVDGNRTGYRLGDAATADLDEAARQLAEADSRLAVEPALALAAARSASDTLAAGPVLAGVPAADWVDAARAEHRDRLRRARRTVAEAALRTGEPALARDAALAAVADDPFDEEAGRALMRAYDGLGEPARALAAFDRLRADLAEELGVDPAPATRDLHLRILRGGAPVPSRVGPATARATALPGRDKETARLAEAWRGAVEGRPALVLLAGEAGIGKTRLADEVSGLARATTGTVLSARCYAAERSLFLQPVVEALTTLVVGMPAADLREAAGDRSQALAALVPEVATVLGAPPPERGSPEAERRRAYDAVAVFLRRLSRGGPVLLVLDDLHNAGVATIELLHYLGRHAADARLLTIATVRSEEGRRGLAALAPVAERVDLGPLDTRAIARLAADAGQEAHVAQIEGRTRGHTLFVVEILRGLAAGEQGVPSTLRESVLGRVGRAGSQAEELLRAAAVLGASFAPPTVAGLLGIELAEATRRCDRLLATRLTVVAGRAYEFANDLVQEVLYETTPEPTRLAYHARAADLLVDNPEAVARHAEAAGDDRRAARAWLSAGQLAARRYASTDADALFGRAVAAATRADDAELLGRAHLGRGRVRETMFRFADALRDTETAVRLGRETGDRRLEMGALYELGGPAWAGIGRPVADGVAHVREALRLGEQLGDRGAEATMLSWLAIVSSNRLRFDEALGYGRRAYDAAVVSGDDAALAAAFDGLKTAHAYLGEVTELATLLRTMAPVLRRVGNLLLLQWWVFESGFPALAAGDWTAAAARVDEAIVLNGRSGHQGYEAWFLAHRGWVARLAGRWDQALADGERAAAMDSHAWFAAAVQAIYATTLIEAGRGADAVPPLERGLAAAETHRTEAYRLRCLAPLAEVTRSPVLLDEADALIDGITAPDGAAWLYGADAYVSVARARLAQGDPARAREILDRLLGAASRTGWLAPLASARELAGQISSASRAAARSAPSVSTGR
jgi:DNA-binding SARP family transcriptional activator